MDKCHTQSSEKVAQERVIVVLPIKLVLITFNDFFFFLILSHQLEWLRGRLNRVSWASFVREFLGNSPAVLAKTLGRLNRRVRLTSILLPLFIPENSLSLPVTKIDL
jgi:hypothetical protein